MKLTRHEPHREPANEAFRARSYAACSRARDQFPRTKGRDQFAGARALNGDDRPLLGRSKSARPRSRKTPSEGSPPCVQDARRAASRRGDVEAVAGHAGDDAVVHDEALSRCSIRPYRQRPTSSFLPGIGIKRLRNVAASGPTTSILPRVEASNIPTDARVAVHSRATAACMSSPVLGKHQARFHSPTSSKAAPVSAAQS